MSSGVRRRLVAATAAIGLAGVLLAGPAAADGQPAAGGAAPVVSGVEVEGLQLEHRDRVLEILGLSPGAPLDRQRLRDGARTLYAGGEIEWLRVASRPDGAGGIVVTVELSERSRIAEIVVHAADGGIRRHTRRWLELRAGEPVSQGQVQAAVRRVERHLRERGFPAARVEPSLDYQRASNSVVVTVDVDPGPPAALAGVELVGVADPDLAAQVLPEMKPGTQLTERLEDRIRNQVESAMRRAGYLEALVVGSERQGPIPHTTLALEVDPGYRYEIVVDAPPAAEELVRDALPDPAKEDLHPAQTGVLAERVRDRLLQRGYLLAEVRAELDASGPQRRLVLHVEPDGQRRIAAVRFEGATVVDRERLEQAVRVHEGRVHGVLAQRVDTASLETDRLAVETLYRERGYVDARVSGPRFEAVGADGVAVVFEIVEGQRWTVTRVMLDGFPADMVTTLEGPEVGGIEAAPFDPRRVESARRRLETALLNAGYPEARVTAAVDTSHPPEAAVTFDAVPGDYVVIADVVVAGLEHTREQVVRREVAAAGVVPGAPLSQQAILEAQRLVYELGLFRRVQIVTVPGQERRTRRGLVVRCDEGLQRSYLFGIGWDNVDHLRATLGWSHLNLLGGAHAFSAELRLSEREQRWQLGLREHRLPWLEAPGYLSVYRTSERFDTWSQLRRGLILEVGDRRRTPRRTWLRYQYQIVKPDAPDEILSDLERQDQEIFLASLTPTFEWDTRDDPLVPSRGLLSSTSLEYAFPAFQATAEFLKLQTFLSAYRPWLDGTAAMGLRLGLIEPLGPDNGEPPNLQVPLATRFFAGGRVSHRAFAIDRLGIVGETLDANRDPIGGNALLILNLEYVQPLRGLLSAVAFVDAGNVWSSPESIDLRQVRWGAGLGLRAATPAGPLRLEYGWKLDREPGESTGELYLSFGIPF